jgi:hypothetical protein
MLFRSPLLLAFVSIYGHLSSCLDFEHDPLQVGFDGHLRVIAERNPRIAIIGYRPRFCADVKGPEQEVHRQHTTSHD